MMSPRAFRRAPSARLALIQFVAYSLRHAGGVVGMFFLANFLRNTGEPLWWLILAFGTVYAATALYHGNKLWKLYRSRVAAESRKGAS